MMRDILLVDAKSHRKQRIAKLAKALADNGWSSIAHGSDKAVYSHPDYPHHAIGLCNPEEWEPEQEYYGYHLFYRHFGTGDCVYINSYTNEQQAINHMINNIFPKHNYEWDI